MFKNDVAYWFADDIKRFFLNAQQSFPTTTNATPTRSNVWFANWYYYAMCCIARMILFCHQCNKSLHGIFQLSYSIDRDSRNIAEMSKYLIYLQITDLSHNTVFLFVEIRKSVEIINFPLMFLDEAILRLLLLHFIWCINDPCITYHKLQSFMTILTFENIKVHWTKLHHSIRTLSCC